METIPKSHCQKIGYLKKPHGIHGGIILQLEGHYSESLENDPIVLLEIDQLLVPFFPSENGIRIRSEESVLIHFEWVENELDAKKICGTNVYLSREDIILPEDEVTLHQLVGYCLFDEAIGEIGKIEQVDDYSGNLILQVQFKNREVLVPFSEDFLVRFDEEKKEIELQCPRGIFDFD